MNYIQECIKYITPLFEKDCSGHDLDHTLRVYNLSLLILKNEKRGDKEIISLASLLHDVDDYKLFKTENNFNARTFLKSINYNDEKIEEIITIINAVSFKGKDSVILFSIEGKIVQDADRLDALGAIGIARAFAYGGAHNRKLYDLNNKIKKSLSFEEYKSSNSDTISHFYEKLLLLKNMMNTEYGKKLANKRTKFIRKYLKEFYKEIEIKNN